MRVSVVHLGKQCYYSYNITPNNLKFVCLPLALIRKKEEQVRPLSDYLAVKNNRGLLTTYNAVALRTM